ncbi:hypothetical protein [Streptomyces sp. FZ201]|uniref:hypothetical protein n=1 Tax=Streptomyces sp. FZ201 TaxID=3057122 RepID=UPI0021C16F19|nr:hypothetical protein [Streptomyces sp. FZ201]
MNISTERTISRRQPQGEVHLQVPTDWFDLLEDGENDEAAHERISDLANQVYAHKDENVRSSIIRTLMAARRLFLDDGMISYGLVALPDSEDGPVTWHICAGVVEAPRCASDINAGEALARYFGEQLEDKQVYLESFPTAMGPGFGLVSQPGIRSNGQVDIFPALPTTDAPPAQYAARIGMAAALSCPASGGPALLVVGSCLDPEQVVSMASLVAVICGKATVQPYGAADEHSDEVVQPWK